MKLPQLLTTTAVIAALALSACGGDDDPEPQTGGQPPAETAQTGGQAPADTGQTGGQAPADAGGEDAVKQAILTWTFEGDCEVMTDKFLEQQSFVGDTREERCDYFKKAYQKPQYSEDDIEFRSVDISGDMATVVIGSAGINVESEYKLVNEGGAWKIDEAGLK
jgi:hypothetical protein